MTFKRIKEALPASDVLTHFLGQSRRRRFLCPFHPDKNPSFSAYGPAIRCFGCQWAGDIFRFVEDHLKVSQREALGILADMAGVILPRKDERKPRQPTMAAALDRIRRESRQIEREILWEVKRAAAQAWRQAWEHRHTEAVWETIAIGAALDRQVESLQVSHD